MQDAPIKQFQCRHIFTGGHRCGSPALRGEHFCYYHHTTRRPVANPEARRGRRSVFQLPMPEDRTSIQHIIGEVLRRIALNEIDPRRAGLLLYGLQTASANLPRSAKSDAAPDPVAEITHDPTLGDLAPVAEVGNTGARWSFARFLREDLERNPPRKQSLHPADPSPDSAEPTADVSAGLTLPAIQAVAACPGRRAPLTACPEPAAGSRIEDVRAGAPFIAVLSRWVGFPPQPLEVHLRRQLDHPRAARSGRAVARRRPTPVAVLRDRERRVRPAPAVEARQRHVRAVVP